MPSKLLTFLFLCLTAGSLLAAEPPVPKAAAKRPAAAVKDIAANVEDDLLPRSVFEVLLGEIALQRGNLDIALGAYVDLARRSQDPQVFARAVEIAIHARQFELVLELSRQWTRVEPDSFKAQQALTTALILLNRTEELGEQIAIMLERDKPRLAENLLYLNRLLARQPDRQAVSRTINKAAAPYLGIAEAHYAMAVAALSAGDQALARRESLLALELRPEWEMAVLLRAQVLAKESVEEARQLLQDFVDRNPKAADARLGLARLLLAEKRYAEARQQFDRILEDFPATAEALYPAAMLALQQNDTTAARLLLERLLSSNFPDKGSLHYFLGQIEEDDKNPEAALAHYRLVVAGEQYMAARARTAQLLAQQGRVDEAIRHLKETAAKTKDEKALLATSEASLLRDAKRVTEAYAVLEAALKLQPDNAELLYDSALLADRLGKKGIAETRLKRVLELKPDHAHAMNALGYTWAEQNQRLDEAQQWISKALALLPNDPFIMDSLGWVQYRQGKLAEALETLQKAFALRPDPEIAAHLGEVLWKLDRREEAKKIWQESLAKHPGNEELTAVLNRHQVKP